MLHAGSVEKRDELLYLALGLGRLIDRHTDLAVVGLHEVGRESHAARRDTEVAHNSEIPDFLQKHCFRKNRIYALGSVRKLEQVRFQNIASLTTRC